MSKPNHLVSEYRRALNRAIGNGYKDLAKIQRLARKLQKRIEAELNRRATKKRKPSKRKRSSLRQVGFWKVMGFDTFSGESYDISKHRTEEAAVAAAQKRLAELEKRQPSSSSGGQGFGGIQDRVFVEGPSGESVRIQ